MHASVNPCTHASIHACMHPCIHASIRPSVHPSIQPSDPVMPSIHPSILSSHAILYKYISIHPSILPSFLSSHPVQRINPSSVQHVYACIDVACRRSPPEDLALILASLANGLPCQVRHCNMSTYGGQHILPWRWTYSGIMVVARRVQRRSHSHHMIVVSLPGKQIYTSKCGQPAD